MLKLRASEALPLRSILAAGFAPYTSLVVLVAMLFGGGARQGLWSNAVVELAALPLLSWSLYYLSPNRLGRLAMWSVILLGAIIALPLLQLIPLPPSQWTAIPGRKEIVSAFTAAGVTLPWMPLSLDPAATWRSLLALLPATAVFLATLSLERTRRLTLITLIFVVAFISVPLDLFQLMGGPYSPLRFYAITNEYRAVGFFANTNHNAAFLYCVIPFAAAWAIGLMHDHRENHIASLLMAFVLLAAVIIGLAIIRSRAGIVLGFVAGLSCLLLVWRHERGHKKRRMLWLTLGANTAALLIAFQFGFVGFMQRVEHSDIIEDIRWPVAQVTSQAAVANMPFGTGFGTFVPIYQQFSPRAIITDRYINHAHNDWLELWLTGGVPALVLMLCFFVWFAGCAVSVWRRGPPGASALDITLARAGSLVVALLLLHSLVDYPLRTAAISVLFAIACGQMVSARASVRGRETTTSANTPEIIEFAGQLQNRRH
jgi:O-Antigen ligase